MEKSAVIHAKGQQKGRTQMGMAASQARLLSITARIHDVEYQAQAIQAAKVQLSTQQDQIYSDYMNALDATTLTINALNVNTGEKSTIAATFNNLCSRKRVTAADGSNYALRNSKGELLVEREIYEGYCAFKNAKLDDAYQFAMYMMSGNDMGSLDGGNDDFATTIEEAEKAVYNALDADKTDEKTTLGKLHKKLEELVGGEDIYNSNTLMSSGDKENIKEYEDTLKQYRAALYKTYSGDIYAKASEQGTDYNVEEDFDSSLFNYYVSIYNQISACGGCMSIDCYDGPDGDAANNSDWLQSMIQSGQFTIEIINTDKKTGEVELNTTSPSSDTCLTYTETASIDSTAAKKAEAEYEHKLKQINKKDEQFDLDLSKLETERSALTTEYDSVKKVIEDNIERTFGIFS